MFLSILLFAAAIYSNAQILGGGTQFSNAVIFDPSWLSACPSGATYLSNQAGFEPTVAMESCAPAPACITGTASSDIWFAFYAQSTTAKISVNPDAAFNVAIQAFSGNACPGLTDIGCIDAGGNGATESLVLTGLTANQLYYFRVFGSSDDITNKTGTGTYTFCGSTQLGATVLPVVAGSFTAIKQNTTVVLNWSATSLNTAYFELERSGDGSNFKQIGRVNSSNTTAQVMQYNFTDNDPLALPVAYYRLKQINTNDNYTYSAIAVVRGGDQLKRSLSILTNPVEQELKAKITSDVASDISMRVIDASGELVYKQNVSIVKGENKVTFNNTRVSNLPKGIYTLQAIINNERLNAKFIRLQ